MAENQEELDIEAGEFENEPDESTLLEADFGATDEDADEGDEVDPDPEKDDPPEFSEAELAAADKIAAKIGYNPDYDGPNKRTAVDFILESRNIQDQQSKSLRDKLKHIDALKDDVSKVVKFVQSQADQKIVTLEDKVKELQTKREDAVVTGDLETFKETEELITETQGAIAEQRIANDADKPGNGGEPQAFQTAFEPWAEKNDWYGKEKAMTVYADTFKNDPAVQDLSDDDYLKFVETEVKKEFAHKFTKPAPTRQTVAGGGAIRSGEVVVKKGNPETVLTRQQLAVLDEYERTIPNFDRKGYAADMASRA